MIDGEQQLEKAPVEEAIVLADRIFLGWVIFEPIYMMWALELLHLLTACWVCLSVTYWINYPGLSKRQVLQILKLKLLQS